MFKRDQVRGLNIAKNRDVDDLQNIYMQIRLI